MNNSFEYTTNSSDIDNAPDRNLTIFSYILLIIISLFLLVFIIIFTIILYEECIKNYCRQNEIMNRYILREFIVNNNNNNNNFNTKNIEEMVEYPNSISVDILLEDTCSICLEQFNDFDKISTNCEHVFHKECIRKWKDASEYNDFSCPLCRTYIQKMYNI